MVYLQRNNDIKVINYTRTDWSNFAFDNAMALQSVGINCKSYVVNKHAFNYIHTSEQITNENIMKEMYQADYVQIFHSDAKALEIFIESGSKAKLIVYHAGSVYRRDPEFYNKLFNPHIYKSVIALPEFAGLGSKNEQYLVGAIDTDSITPAIKSLVHPYIFAHYPSSYEKKGSYDICRMMEEIKIPVKFSSDTISMMEHYKRVMECDIYIELFKPILEGNPYGSFGIQALEAAAMGKSVVTQNMNEDVYFNEYGFCRLMLANNETDFKDIVELLDKSSPDEIKNLQEETRQWVVDNHSYKSTGLKLLKKILN